MIVKGTANSQSYILDEILNRVSQQSSQPTPAIEKNTAVRAPEITIPAPELVEWVHTITRDKQGRMETITSRPFKLNL